MRTECRKIISHQHILSKLMYTFIIISFFYFDVQEKGMMRQLDAVLHMQFPALMHCVK